MGSIEYTYADRCVGSANLTATNAVVDTFRFLNDKDEKNAEDKASANTKQNTNEEKVIQINMTTILLLLLVVLAALLLVFLVWKFIDNFYYIKRKFHLNRKEKSPYKTIKENKFYKRKGRKRF